MMHRVAVYGTLKRGGSNSTLLRRADFLGEDVLTELTLYNLGPYPGAVAQASAGVRVEVYNVDDQALRALDALEDYFPEAPEDSLYLRRQIATQYGTAWVYLYNRPVENDRRMPSGVW